MESYVARDYLCLKETEGRFLLWLPDEVAYCEIDSASMAVLRELHHPKAAEVIAVAGLPKPETLLRLQSLEESGAVARVGGARHDPVLEPALVELTPVAFRVVLTEACNFHCPECFSTTALLEQGKRLRSMSRETVNQVIASLRPFAIRHPITLHFFGGEPLLRFDLIQQFVRSLEELVSTSAIRAPIYSVTTNGYLVTDPMIEFFREHHFRVGVSIESSQERHNALRKTRSGVPTFFAVKENYLRMADAGVDVHVLVTPFLADQQDLASLVGWLVEQFPARQLTINTAFDRNTMEWLVCDDYAQQLVECERVAQAHGISLDTALTPILAAISHQTRRQSPHAMLGDEVMLGIDPRGNFSRSTHKWSLEFHLAENDRGETHVTGPSGFCQTCASCEARFVCGGVNEEVRPAEEPRLDLAKCRFHVAALRAIAENLDLFLDDEDPDQI